jgi:hypothetical protein
VRGVERWCKQPFDQIICHGWLGGKFDGIPRRYNKQATRVDYLEDICCLVSCYMDNTGVKESMLRQYCERLIE